MARTTTSKDKKIAATPAPATKVPRINTSAAAKPAGKTTSQESGADGVKNAPKPRRSRRGQSSALTKTDSADHPGKTEVLAVSNKPFRAGSKGTVILDLLKQEDGATITMLTEATGWQQHSVRGFISGALKKDRGITIAGQKDGAGNRRYKIVASGG